MPEYLSPGVYVEEIPSGNKPIEGVSTSTAGLVGVAERGPVDVPQLVTSFGEYRRTFGGYLDLELFTDPNDRAHCYLPHAVEGFFTNGGKRAWITRVVPNEATRAERRLCFFDTEATQVEETVLLRAAEQGTGTAINQPQLYVLEVGDLAVGDLLRVGDGSRSEYREVADVDGLTARHASLHQPLQRTHAVGLEVRNVARTVDTDYTTGDFVLDDDVEAGATEIIVSVGTTAADVTVLQGLPGGRQLLEVGTASLVEYVTAIAATGLGAGVLRLTLRDALTRSHDAGQPVLALELPVNPPNEALTVAANAGDLLVYVADASGYATGDLVAIAPDTDDQEVRRIGELSELELELGAYEDYPAGSVMELVTIEDDDRTVSASTTTTATLDSVAAIVPGMELIFDTGVSFVTAVNGSVVTLAPALPAAPTVASAVEVQSRALTAEAAAGAVVISLDNRLGLDEGDVLRIGAAPDEEYVIVSAVSEPRKVPPDAGAVILESPLARTHAPGFEVRRQHAPTVDATRQPAQLVLPTGEGADVLLVNDGTGYSTGEIVQVTTPSGNVHYHEVEDNGPAAPGQVTLVESLERSHAAGATLAERQPLFTVRALDPGAWGNRVLIANADEEDGLLQRAEVTAVTPSPGPGLPSTLRLTTVTGVEAGTVLELRDPTGTQAGAFLKVRQVDRPAGNLVILDAPGVQPEHVTAHAAAAALGLRLTARSREFRLDVMLLLPAPAAIPSRSEDLLDREAFRQLSMDQRHSRYFERIIGSTWTDGAPSDDLERPLRRSDRRSEGISQYVRVHDLGGSDLNRERVRLGPEALSDVLPSGLLRAARHRLGEADDAAIRGDDSVATMGDAIYLGVDDREPERRTGIFAFKNLVSLPLVAAPGQSTPAVQQALIDHCEEQRYRFAVLDAQGPSSDTLADVQAQRQQYDTKYAALYHPWVTIPDPFPDTVTSIQQFPVPPSGHVLGVYARTDVERGVHKAPANEVVRGITGLTRSLNKGEHDILNAYPVHIDVIRDFRPNNRGIRIWGARCITSDSDYKYVNVRRLLIFLEDSIDRGLQWVVFEPNAEELWARVRRAITNFLAVVWRNGALEGATMEQAFFVKCDRTTMTQTEIDNGQLICLVGVAPVKPAEFVIVRIGLWTADAES